MPDPASADVAAPSRGRSAGGRLIGRRRELERIERLLAEPAEGSPQVIQIAGESGIGKTRLLSHALELAAQTGWCTLVGRAAEFESDEPFGVFIGALDHVCAELSDDALAALGEENLRELSNLLPALATRIAQTAEPLPERPAGVGMDRYRLHRAVAALLGVLAAGRPLLLVVDDLHWADPASVELLLYLLRRPPEVPLCVAVAFRSRQLGPKASAALQQAQRDSHGELIELSPLSAEEARAFVPANVPPATAERLYRDSGGNPFYLEELVRALREGDEPLSRAGDGDGDPLPPSVTAVIANELDRLTPQARELAQAASVVGDPFEPEIAGEIVDIDGARALDALDELSAHDLVQASSVPGRFTFRHAIVRRAVYESAGSGWRRSAHARAAAVLGQRGAPAAARARHVERSASFGDAEAIRVLSEAGYASTARAPAAAASWFRAALRLLPEEEDSGERLGLLLATAVSLGSAGDLEASRDAFQEVLELQPATTLRSSAVAAAALVEHLLGNHDQAQGLLLAALPGLDDDAPEAAELKLEIADGCFFSADWDGMRYWAQRALEVGEPTPMLQAGVGAALALAHYGLQEAEAAEECAARAAAIADRMSDAEWASRLQSICLLGWSEYCVGRLDDAEHHMKRALAVSRTTGQEHLSAAMLVVRSMSNLALGRLAAATEYAETAIDTSLLSANQLFLTWALTVRCMVEIDSGTPSSAVRFGRKAVEAGIESRSAWSSVATLYLAEAWLEAGEPEQFRRELFAGESTPRLPPFAFYAVHAYELLTRAELELGLPAAAERWVEQATELAERIALPAPRAEAQRARARLLLGEGDFVAAASTARGSAEEAERSGQPLQAARSRLIAGTALRQLGDPQAAVEELRRAEGAFAAYRAWRYRDQAARELRRLGVHALPPRGPAPLGADLQALSRREQTIANLVHEGRTNKEIAEELSISIKTVENHLTKIFRQLELSSRAQLATLVERSGGVPA